MHNLVLVKKKAKSVISSPNMTFSNAGTSPKAPPAINKGEIK